MHRILLLALLVLAAAMGSAWAQVAAPSLLPATPGVADPTMTKDPSIVPTNPAVLGWPTPTRLAAGVIRADRTHGKMPFTAGGSVIHEEPGQSFEYEGTYAGGLYHRDGFGIALGALSIRDVVAERDALDDYRARIGAGAMLGSNLAIGAGYHFDSDRQDNGHQRTRGTLAGASLRLFDRFYLGIGGGKDDAETGAANSSGRDSSGTSTINVAGIGYLSTGNLQLHVEVWGGRLTGENRSEGAHGTSSANVQAASAEAKMGVFVIGYSYFQVNAEFEAGNGKIQVDWTATEATIGVYADHGFGVLFHYGQGETNSKQRFDGTPFGLPATIAAKLDTASKAQSVTVVWQY